MDTEQHPGWARRPLPHPVGTQATWTWTVCRPAELTAARNDLRRHLAASSWATDPDAPDRLLLAFEELASNGLRHGGATVQVRVDGCARGWLIDVSDARPDRPPVPAVDRDSALCGLGLHLVAFLSAAVGWAVVGTRKHVWAALLPTG